MNYSQAVTDARGGSEQFMYQVDRAVLDFLGHYNNLSNKDVKLTRKYKTCVGEIVISSVWGVQQVKFSDEQ